MDEGTHLLDALRPPQAQQDEEPEANAEKVADGSDDMQKQDDGVDAHQVPPCVFSFSRVFSFLASASCSRAICWSSQARSACARCNRKSMECLIQTRSPSVISGLCST